MQSVQSRWPSIVLKCSPDRNGCLPHLSHDTLPIVAVRHFSQYHVSFTIIKSVRAIPRFETPHFVQFANVSTPLEGLSQLTTCTLAQWVICVQERPTGQFAANSPFDPAEDVSNPLLSCLYLNGRFQGAVLLFPAGQVEKQDRQRITPAL